jgi:preprotein translocase subunit SecE
MQLDVSSSIGRAAVSKAAGCRFDSCLACFRAYVDGSIHPVMQVMLPAASAAARRSTINDMALAIYKSGQGYWTRTLTAVGAAALVIAGLAWILPYIRHANYELEIRSGLVVVVLAAVAALLWWLLNKPRIADFMIATEQEMKKVAWPSRRDLVTFTMVVIAGTLLMALLLWLVDLGFVTFFRAINILQA